MTNAMTASSSVIAFCSRLTKKLFREESYITIVFIFLCVLGIFKLYFIHYGPLDLSPDEAHYWEWSRRLDLSYYSKGPVIAYLIALGTSIFGDSVLGVRVFAVLFSFLSSLMLYRLGKEMFEKKVGAASAVLFQIIPLYAAFGVIFTIDSPFIFFWILSLYLFWRAVQDENLDAGCKIQNEENIVNRESHVIRSASRRYWILVGVSVGFGLLTKYTMAFFYICSLFFILSSSEQRKVLKTPQPYISLVISLIIFSPVIIWNALHEWVTFRHTAGQAHIADGLTISVMTFLNFLGSQLGVVTPIMLVLIIAAILQSRRGKIPVGGDAKPQKRKGSFIFWFSFPVIFFFVLKSLQGKVQANWAMMGYVTGIIAFSSVFVAGWKRRSRYVKAWIVAGICLSVIVTVAAYYPSKFHIPIQLDPSARLRGWKELGKATDDLYRRARLRGQPFVFSDSYQVSSELAFYMKRHPVIFCINLGRRMNQYDLWPNFDDLVHSDAIFVTIGDQLLPTRVGYAFEVCEKNLHKVYEKGELLRELTLFVCRNFEGMQEKQIKTY